MPNLTDVKDYNGDNKVDDADVLESIRNNYFLYGTLATRYNSLILTIDIQNSKCDELMEKLKNASK